MSEAKYSAAVITVSDSRSRGEREDRSGPATAEVLRQHGFGVVYQSIVPDDRPAIEEQLLEFSDQVHLIVTTGGTGVAERDVTPEATRAVCSKLIEGIPEKMRATGSENNPLAALSRGVCGVRARTLILNLPGSPSGAVDSLQAVIDILPHAIDLLAGAAEHDA
jgi:molybdopterin adenylyltransferase